MGLQTDLNLAPYYDDYDETKDFYRILFRPGVAVQVRELNQLQSIIQKQIERFGDNILKRGTIVDGCQISFFPAVAYVRIKDSTADLKSADISLYKGYSVKNSANLVARVIDYATGFENQGEDTNTLYLDYINSGSSGSAAAFTQGQVLTVFDSNNAVYSAKINAGSAGFSISDTVVVYPAIEIQDEDGTTANFDGTFVAGQTIIQDTGTYVTQLEIISVDTTANTKAYVLRVKPLVNDLKTANTGAWSQLAVGYTIRNSGNTASANVSGVVGTECTADLQISPTGKITEINILTIGSGYYVAPHITVSTSTASAGQISALDITARNYIDKITVLPNVALATGSAYGVSVTDGIIYQKGFFARVEEQFVIIDKYANTPHQQSVGFVSQEKIVDFKSDETLLDNAGGSLNVNAPGANRLQITPMIQVFDDVDAQEDPEFFPIVSFSEGKPFRQYRTTAYNKIADEMAKRTSEESGDYVLDKFLIATRSPLTHNLESTSFSLVIDPGHAYIDGYRVQTLTNYIVNLSKGTDTESVEDSSFDTVYGNYLRVDELGGAFIFKTGADVDLYDQPRNYISSSASEITSNGTLIGTARIRSVVYETGTPGSPNAIYRLHLFDINMSNGKNFKNTRSIFYSNGLVNNAIADAVLEIDPSANGSVYIAAIKNPQESSLMFGSGNLEAIKEIPNLTYTYRTTANVNFSNTGVVTYTLTNPNDTFPYTGELSEREKDELILTPVLEVMPASETLQNGDISTLYYDANTDLITIEGSNTAPSFLTTFKVNDWIYIYGANNVNTAQWARITTIKDANTMYAEGANTIGYVEGDSTIKIGFNEAVQVNLKDSSGRTANVSANGKVLTITTNIGSGASVPAVLTFNVKASNTSVISKTPTRDVHIKIRANTHIATTTGPWCIGYPDIIRLKAVYKSNNINTVNANSTDVTKEFYIDHNQTKNHYDLGFLMKKPSSKLTIAANDALLVQFDYLDHSASGGLKTIGSYPVNDSLTLAQLTTSMNTLEIPEVFGSADEYYDLRDIIDFRPTVSPTANATVSEADAAMTINPEYYGQTGGVYSNDAKFDGDDKKFPSPEHDVIFDFTKYKGRVDSVIVNSFNEFNVLKDEIRDPNYKGEIILNHIVVPPYPSLPDVFSQSLTEISDTKMANEKYAQVRVNKYVIETPSVGIQPRGYTMQHIGKLERRIEALEYYARLSETEDIFKDRPIPSALDPTLDRYKFGFFVDNFSGPEFADLRNPEYNASIYEFRLYPNRKDIALKFKFSEASKPLLNGDTAIFPYTDYRAVRQPYATTGPITVNPPPTGTDPWCTQCIIVYNQNKNGNPKPSNSNNIVYEERVFTLTNNTNAQGYIMVLDYDFEDHKNRIEIFQATTPTGFTSLPVATSETATGTADPASGKVLNGSVLLTGDQRVYNTGRRIFDNYGKGGPWTVLNRPDFSHVAASGLTAYPGVQNLNRYWTKNAGRINVKLDLGRGRYLKVRVVKGLEHFAYTLCVPVNCPPPPPPPKPPPPPPPKPPPRIICIPPPRCVCIVIQKDAKPAIVNKFISFIDAERKALKIRIDAQYKTLFGKAPVYK